jgi:hypothetical protein
VSDHSGWIESQGPGDRHDVTWVYRKAPEKTLPLGSDALPQVAFLTVSFDEGPRVGEAPRAAAAALESLAVAVILKPGMRDLVFYTKSAETFEARVEALQSRWPAWRLAGAVFYDPLWMQYREMP